MWRDRDRDGRVRIYRARRDNRVEREIQDPKWLRVRAERLREDGRVFSLYKFTICIFIIEKYFVNIVILSKRR